MNEQIKELKDNPMKRFFMKNGDRMFYNTALKYFIIERDRANGGTLSWPQTKQSLKKCLLKLETKKVTL